MFRLGIRNLKSYIEEVVLRLILAGRVIISDLNYEITDFRPLITIFKIALHYFKKESTLLFEDQML